MSSLAWLRRCEGCGRYYPPAVSGDVVRCGRCVRWALWGRVFVVGLVVVAGLLVSRAGW